VLGRHDFTHQESSYMHFSRLFVASLTTVAFAGCMNDDGISVDSPELAAGAATTNGVSPQPYDGNFVAPDDDQVCYELDSLVGWGVTNEMRGFKIDNPTNGTVTKPGVGTFTVTQPYLAWAAAAGVDVLGVIVKGANAFNLFDYEPYSFTSDSKLHAPLNKKNKLPDISHYNICYQPPPVTGEQGCTPGYWRNHADRWTGVAATAGYDATFGISSIFGATFTLAQAVQAPGGGEAALARHATAGLLNSYGGIPNADGTTVAYPYTTELVISLVQGAYATADDPLTLEDEHAAAIEAVKNALAAANERGCPLSGTSAIKV
jgi:hypothetical protein